MKYSRGLRWLTERDESFFGQERLLAALGARGNVLSYAKSRMDKDPKHPNGVIISAIGRARRIWSSHLDGAEMVVLQKGHCFLELTMETGLLVLSVFSRRFDAKQVLLSTMQRLRKYRLENDSEDGVWANFSFAGAHGPSTVTQFLACPQWAKIRENYVPELRSELDALMKMRAPWESGRLMIWHGPAGTGKTYAIRSLMMAWRKRFNYLGVTDPEKFASTPSYYYQVAGDSGIVRKTRGRLPNDEERTGGKKRSVFIMEDCADLILTESRQSHYDKVGKLLNATDGLFGQGREDIFLVTFNEDVEEIDPAFLRPGRCIANLEFPPFSGDEAAEWLGRRGVERNPGGGPMTLAEMYQMLHKKKAPSPARRDKAVGFAAAGS